MWKLIDSKPHGKEKYRSKDIMENWNKNMDNPYQWTVKRSPGSLLLEVRTQLERRYGLMETLIRGHLQMGQVACLQMIYSDS